VLGDVAEPGPLAQSLDEPSGLTPRAGVPLQARQQLEELVGEEGDGVRRVALEDAEVDDEMDRLLVGPDVRAAVDA